MDITRGRGRGTGPQRIGDILNEMLSEDFEPEGKVENPGFWREFARWTREDKKQQSRPAPAILRSAPRTHNKEPAMIDVELVFEKYNDEFLKFDRVENKLHTRPDICAFLMIDSLLPGGGKIVCSAEHDMIYLDADCEMMADVATETGILALVRCGVFYDTETAGLAMYA